MIYGYARVSFVDQNEARQIDAIQKAVERVEKCLNYPIFISETISAIHAMTNAELLKG